MEILSAGSFINLENKEKIGQLKHTAFELANAAIGTTGFVNEEEPARKLALEFWQGLEYMCRENEQATIQSIFTGHFLERLREFRSVNSETKMVAIDENPTILAETSQKLTNSEDEFLGVVDASVTEAATLEEDRNLNRNLPTQVEEFSEEGNESVENVPIEISETVSSEPSLEKPEIPAVKWSAETEQSKAEDQVEVKTPVNSLILPEKEPYQFDKCTVTATIQLLPTDENSDFRKVILSVRTHDFAPQISMVEISRNNLPLALTPEIEKGLAKYEADLPVKVMDKMKREKSKVKKSVSKPAAETKTISQDSTKTKEMPPSQNAQTATVENNSSVIPPATAETALQGSLF